MVIHVPPECQSKNLCSRLGSSVKSVKLWKAHVELRDQEGGLAQLTSGEQEFMNQPTGEERLPAKPRVAESGAAPRAGTYVAGVSRPVAKWMVPGARAPPAVRVVRQAA